MGMSLFGISLARNMYAIAACYVLAGICNGAAKVGNYLCSNNKTGFECLYTIVLYKVKLQSRPTGK